MSNQTDSETLPPLIDAGSATEIIELLGRPRYLELLRKLVDQAQEKTALIARETLQKRELDVQEHLHSLKGPASSLFAARLAQKIESLEHNEQLPSALELASLRDCARQTLRAFVEANSEPAHSLTGSVAS